MGVAWRNGKVNMAILCNTVGINEKFKNIVHLSEASRLYASTSYDWLILWKLSTNQSSWCILNVTRTVSHFVCIVG